MRAVLPREPLVVEVDPARGSERGVRLSLLEGFELRFGSEAVRLPMSVQRLLAFLALENRPLQRVYVAGCLWANASERHAAGNLRSALWRMQRFHGQLIEPTRSHLRIGRTVVVDVAEMVMQASRLLDPQASGHAEDFDHRTLTGDLLPDWYDDWVAVHRERLRQLRLHGLEALCRRLTAQRMLGRAVQAGVAAVVGEPLRESANRALIEAHLADGNLAEAIRHYSWYRRLLYDELGVDPSPSMTTLVQDLRVG